MIIQRTLSLVLGTKTMKNAEGSKMREMSGQ